MNRKALFFVILFSLFVLGGNVFYHHQNKPPLHITLVASLNDPAAKALMSAAKDMAPSNAEIRWIDKPSDDAPYPLLDKAAVYVCADVKCSLPAFNPSQLHKLIERQVNAEQGSSVSLMGFTLMNPVIFIPLSWIFGVLLGMTTCALPTLLIMTMICGGSSAKLGFNRTAALALTYLATLAVLYGVIGMMAGATGKYYNYAVANMWVVAFLGVLFVFLGFSTLGLVRIKLIPNRFIQVVREKHVTHNKSPFVKALLMGFMGTLIASPCVFATLLGFLYYVSRVGDMVYGGLMLMFIGIGFGSPLLAIYLLQMNITQLAGHWQKTIKIVFGFVLLALAIWLLDQLFPSKVIMFLWAALAFFIGIYIDSSIKHDHDTLLGLERDEEICSLDGEEKPSFKARRKGVRALYKMLSIMIILYGVLIFVGALLGDTNPASPLERQIDPMVTATVVANEYKIVKSLSELDQAKASDKLTHKPIVLLFTASWCTACNEIKSHVFTEESIVNLLNQFDFIHVDLSDNAAGSLDIASQYHVVGPPTLLFFDDQGRESTIRFEGIVSTEQFLNALQTVLNNKAN